MIKTTPVKQRSDYAYKRKVEKITKWHARLEKFRKNLAEFNPNTKVAAVRKPLQPLEFYISKIKKPLNR